MKRLLIFVFLSIFVFSANGQGFKGRGASGSGIKTIADTSGDSQAGKYYYNLADGHIYAGHSNGYFYSALLARADGDSLVLQFPLGTDATKWLVVHNFKSALTVTETDSVLGSLLFSTISEPASPSVGEVYSDGNALWYYNGSTWQELGAQMGTPAWYGVMWDAGADTYTRLGSISGYSAAQTVPDAYLPIQSRMKGCLLKNDGTVYKYLRSDNRNYYEDGSASTLTGPYQVVVEIAKFYYFYHYNAVDSTHIWKVAEDSIAGYIRHPAFIKDGIYVNYRYIGAYEASLYDVSNGAYANGLYLPTTATYQFSFIDGGGDPDTVRCVNGSGSALTHPFTNLEAGEKIVISGTTSNNLTVTVIAKSDLYFTVATATLTTETSSANVYAQTAFAADTLASISGKAPVVQGTRANFRTAASLRGAGWRQYDYQLLSAIQLLYLIEYASFNSQSKIGNGLTDWSSAWPGWNDYNPIEKTGLSNAKGNFTFNVSGGNGVTGSYMSYRGIENWFGHVWKPVDGLNFYNNIAYFCNNETQYTDNDSTNYTRIGTLINADGWQKYLLNTLNGFLPSAVGALSSTYIADYYYQNTGWRVALLGGIAHDGSSAGAFFLSAVNGSTSASRSIGARLAY